ncbi:hypothetical protein [Cylindrospermum sp. FACHB-282]|uniref:hypothetical protein n=1 Tax=Cylindrospermum sp. FACHB-282 TaxID=2692794 RepID=UPI001682F053|nr:hypothetical protein [Cylindrospermum sp. FACHB-282]MBD2386863.1 hypothetical protein [Cylindrospermum sp. FACHB-282]
MKFMYLSTTIVSFFIFSLPSLAVSISFTGDLTGAPLFDSPNEGNPPTSTVNIGEIFPYISQPFFVSNSGTYNFLSQVTGLTTQPLSPGATNWNNVTILYGNSFDPENPLTNAVIANDNFPDTLSSGFNGINLIANTQYFLVTTVFNPDDGFGTFNNTIAETVSTGSNNINLGSLPPATDVPEPTTFPGTLLFTSGIAVALWQGQRRQFQIKRHQKNSL